MSAPTLTKRAEQPTMVEAPASGDVLSLFERLASNGNVSVENIERLMGLWERVEAKKAEAAFNEAMAAAQQEMRPVAADALNPMTRSRYASYAALDRALRPIYSKYGFALSFDTAESPKPDHIRVICAVRRGGHAVFPQIDMPCDGVGAKGNAVMTRTHAAGSAVSYGMRYLLKMIFNVAVGEDDDDGNAAVATPAPPDGYHDWLDALRAKAKEGLPALQAMWRVGNADPSLKPFAHYLTRVEPELWNDIKKQAAKVAK